MFLILVLSCSNSKDPNSEATFVKVPLGDPFIMLWEDTYYAYGTLSESGIAVFVSDDLQKWRVPANVPQGLALHKADVWGDKWFWAPEVYEVDGLFYMYFSAEEHICVAVSDNPLGPFTQEDKAPMLEHIKGIDNSLVWDGDKPYLLFNRFNDGNVIWIAELEMDLKTIKEETMVQCINVSQPWEEVWPRVNEGGFIIKHGDKFYMTYSANSYESQDYGVGYATADHITGPWTKYAQNPVLQNPGNLVGVGHSALFTDKEGNLRKVFHAHNSNELIHPRHMYVTTVTFSEDGIMQIDPNFITPQLVVD